MDAVDPRSKTEATRLEVAKAELLKAVEKLKNSAKVNVVFFGTDVGSFRKSLATLLPESERLSPKPATCKTRLERMRSGFTCRPVNSSMAPTT